MGCVVDEKYSIVSCPAYMREDSIADVAQGIEAAIGSFVKKMSLGNAEKVA